MRVLGLAFPAILLIPVLILDSEVIVLSFFSAETSSTVFIITSVTGIIIAFFAYRSIYLIRTQLKRQNDILREQLDGLSAYVKTPAPQHEYELLPSDGYSLEWLIQLHEIVERRLGEFDLKAEDIAHDLNMSRTQFFRLIKKDIGITPSEYLEKARFQHALHLLESGKASSVKAAAYGAGFRQVKYFSKLFKQRFGKLPSDCLVK